MNFNALDPLTIVSSVLFLGVMVVFSVGFLVNWARNRKVIAAYKYVGFRAMLIVVGFEVLTLLLAAPSLFLNAVTVIVGLAVLMLRIWAFVNNGIFFSNKLGQRSFSLVAPWLGWSIPVELEAAQESTAPIEPANLMEPAITFEGVSPIESTMNVLTSSSLELAGDSASAVLTLPASAVVLPAAPPLEPTRPARYWLTTLGTGLGAVVYSLLLFAVTGPSVGLALRDLVTGTARTVTPLMLLLFLEVAFTEELIFRLGIQNYLAAKLNQRRHSYWIAIVLTSIIWTLGHAGVLEPNWIKLAQIFPIGLTLGWLYRRNGVESTIIAHGLFNVVGAFVISIG